MADTNYILIDIKTHKNLTNHSLLILLFFMILNLNNNTFSIEMFFFFQFEHEFQKIITVIFILKSMEKLKFIH